MSTPHPDAAAAAHQLHAEHLARRPFGAIRPWPADAGDGYAYDVQDALLRLRHPAGVARGGYKIGLTTPVIQKLCRGDQPIAGVMLASGIRKSPARIAAGAFVRLGIESELAVRLARPLPTGRVDRAQVAACVDEIATAFELIEDRGADYDTLDWRWIAADNGWHAGLVLGEIVAARDIAALDGVLEIDGRAEGRGSTRDVLGHPFEAVAWLANHLRSRGSDLRPGEWVSTGSVVTTKFAVPGQRFRFTIAGLPPVQLEVGE